MEDVVCVEFHKGDDGETIEFVYFAVFDGHGGKEAACFAKEHLLKEITKHRGFWSDDDRHVLKAITDGFISTHKLMWKTVGLWPKRMSGQPSTAGTTASIAILRRGKMYVGHVGDSGVVLGTQQADAQQPQAHCVTVYHKPNSPEERKRIEENGGQVLPKAGVHRVVWNRPKALHSGPIRRSTPLDAIPFLAVARSLGDLWSYNSHKNVFVVSPQPDVYVYNLDPHKHKFVILASDGLWDMVKADEATDVTHQLSTCMEGPYAQGNKTAAFLVRMSLERWASRCLRADNTSVIVAYFDPPGTLPADLTREASIASTASTLLTSDLAGNTSLHDRDPLTFDENFGGDDVELDPSFYDGDEGIRMFQSVHKKHGGHKKRKHVTKGNRGAEENRIARRWSLGKSNRLLQKKTRCLHSAKLRSCPLKHSVSEDLSTLKVPVGQPDRSVLASTADLHAEKTDKVDQQPGGDSADLQQKCIVPQERSADGKADETVASCSGHGVRQVASNITNSSHCLNNSDMSVTCTTECEHEQALRQKSPLKDSLSEGSAPALVAAMWPSSMAPSADDSVSRVENALRRCRSKKLARKTEESENEDKSHRCKAAKRQHSPGGCRPLKRRRVIGAVKSRLLKTVIHRTRLHVKTALRRS